MSSKISLLVGLIGLAANVLLTQSAAAKSSTEIAKTTAGANIIAIAEAKKLTASDRFAAGIQKYRKGDVQGALADFNQAITSGRLCQRTRSQICDRLLWARVSGY
jgi:hypothetical protein